MLKITDIKPYPKNAKRHPVKQIKALAQIVREVGWRVPMLVNQKGVIIAGHGRWLTWEKYQDELPDVWIIDDAGNTIFGGPDKRPMTEEQEKIYRLADNKLAEGEMDNALVLEELRELDLAGFDISLTGFDRDVILEKTELAEKPIEEAQSRCQVGDLWQLGEHTLLVGDCTNPDLASTLLGEDRAELLFTSPPYSDAREYNGDKDLSIDTLSGFLPVFEPFVEYAAVNLGIIRKDNEVYQYWDSYIEAARGAGYKLLSWNVWEQDGAGSIGKQTAFFPIEHEFIFVFGKKFKHINRTEMRDSKRRKKRSTHREKDGSIKEHTLGEQRELKEMGTIIYVPSEKTDIRNMHPAIFPVELAQKYIEVLTNKGDLVVDPFAGSGSVMIACELTGRKARMIELDPKYGDVIIARYEQYSKKDAVKLN